MADKDFQAQIDKLISTFIKAERQNIENTPKFQKWVKSICEPSYKLISNLLSTFLDELTSFEMRENIFKLFTKLYYLNEGDIAPQLINNSDFAKTCVLHITKGDKDKLSDNSFYLLTKLFNKENFKNQIDEKFIEALFDGLSIIKDEDILNEVVRLLIEISNTYENTSDNLFLKIHKKNRNARVLDEILLRVLNTSYEIEDKLKVLKCLNELLNSESTPIFYSSDMESFIDILLSKMQMTDHQEIIKEMTRCLEKVVGYDEYNSIKYRSDDISEMMKCITGCPKCIDETKILGQEVLNKLS